MEFRKAGMEDLALVAEYRKKMIADSGQKDTGIDKELEEYTREKMEDGSLVEWLTEEEGEVVATGAIVFYHMLPSSYNRTGWKGFIANMWTRPDHRRQGLATRMLDLCVAEARARGVTQLWLGASAVGKPVYQKYGFKVADDLLEMNVPKEKEK